MKTINNQIEVQSNKHTLGDQSTAELKLYNLLFAGKISMKEYLHELALVTKTRK